MTSIELYQDLWLILDQFPHSITKLTLFNFQVLSKEKWNIPFHSFQFTVDMILNDMILYQLAHFISNQLNTN